MQISDPHKTWKISGANACVAIRHSYAFALGKRQTAMLILSIAKAFREK